MSSCLVCQIYCVRSSIGGDFNLVVWQFFVHLLNLNNANICIAATAFCQIKVMAIRILTDS